MANVNIVADIGGTNMRVAISHADSTPSHIEVFQCADYQGIEQVLSTYIENQGLNGKRINACLAIACPVDQDLITMTNLPWQFSQSALKEALKLNQLHLINDYTAIAHAIPLLSDAQKVQIGEGVAVAGRPISICGPGTGLGVANVVPVDDKWVSLGGEGGHVDYAPTTELEIKVLNYLLVKYEHVSYEQLLSGLGIEQIHQALWFIENGAELTDKLSAQQISSKATDGSCELCKNALMKFCAVLGSFAGNLALTLGSFGGVYIAGGIVPRFIEFIENSEFRARFEAKGRLSSFNKDIPTFVVTESQPGLIGASAYLQQCNKEEL